MKPGGDTLDAAARANLADGPEAFWTEWNRTLKRELHARHIQSWLALMDPADIDRGRVRWGRAFADLVAFYQAEAEYLALDYYAETARLAEQEPVLKAVTEDGVEWLRAYNAAQVAGPITMKQRVTNGWAERDAFTSALKAVLRSSDDAYQRAYDRTVTEALLSDTRVVGWRRVIIPPSCSRCSALAGRMYRGESVAFRRHPGCDCGMQAVWLAPGRTLYDYNRRGASVLADSQRGRTLWRESNVVTRYQALRREARYNETHLPFGLAEARANPDMLDAWRDRLGWYGRATRPDASEAVGITDVMLPI